MCCEERGLSRHGVQESPVWFLKVLEGPYAHSTRTFDSSANLSSIEARSRSYQWRSPRYLLCTHAFLTFFFPFLCDWLPRPVSSIAAMRKGERWMCICVWLLKFGWRLLAFKDSVAVRTTRLSYQAVTTDVAAISTAYWIASWSLRDSCTNCRIDGGRGKCSKMERWKHPLSDAKWFLAIFLICCRVYWICSWGERRSGCVSN